MTFRISVSRASRAIAVSLIGLAALAHVLDHDEFGPYRSKLMNVIESKDLERDAGGRPAQRSGFPHPAPGVGVASASPYRPADDSAVLLAVPRSTAMVEARLRDRHKKLAAQKDDLPAALELARLAIRDGRQSADPRRYGQAQAALAPWWGTEDMPLEARVLRAVVRQALHDFSGAAADLDHVLEREPGHVQARLSRAFVEQATGALAKAAEDCEQIPREVGGLAVVVCLARVASSTGGGGAALDRLSAAIVFDRRAAPELRRWAAGVAAEIAVSLGRSDEAANWFSHATVGGGDIPTLVAYADYLLDAGRAADVLPLLMDRPVGDVVLLRLAIAAKAARDPRLEAWSERLSDGFALARASGNDLHLREEARFSLEVAGDAARALDLARRNWAVQKEPADARLVLAAALAAEKPEAAAEVLAFIERTRLDDVRLKPLVDRLGAKKVIDNPLEAG